MSNYNYKYSGQRLTRIPEECKREIHTISFTKYLNLSNNEITEINASEICDLIETIDLSSNKIKSVSFENLKNLKQIYLSKNALVSMEEASTFKNLDKLHLLKLNKNKIKLLNKDIFKKLDSLSEIDLSDNALSTIDFSIFADQFNKLNRLDLSSNRIEDIDSKCLIRFEKLDFLDLSSNNIRKFELVLLRKNLKINLSLNEELKFNLAGFKFIKYAKDISINKCKEIIQFSLNNIVCTSPNNKFQCQLESFMVCFFKFFKAKMHALCVI